MPAIHPRDITFLELRNSFLCSDCELISYNNTHKCLACGSSAVLNLSRTLGGSLRGQQRVRMVAEESQARVIQARPHLPAVGEREFPVPAVGGPHQPDFGRCGIAPEAISAAESAGSSAIDSAMKLVVEHGYRLSRSGGAAIAANHNGRMVCEARMGTAAPALGAEVRSGISALSVRTGRTLRCDVAADDARVDAASCRALGINSIVASPIVNLDRVLGLVTVLSPQPYAFDDRDVAIVQSLAGLMSVVFTGAETDLSFLARSSTRAELPDRA